MVRGIDVSTHNGTLDWASIGAAGIRFAIIRAGYGRYAVDDQFAANIRGAAVRNIPAGVYWFSYAVSEDAARQEAEKCLETIRGYNLTLPVFYDFEYDSVRYAQQQGVTVGREQYNRFARAFLEKIRAAGYTPGIYYNLDYYRTMADPAVLGSYCVWFAQYADRPSISDWSIWQYTGSGTIAGLPGRFDLNELKDECLLHPVRTGWQQENGKWYYYDEAGEALKNQWIVTEGNAFYLGEDGAMVTNRTLKLDGDGKLVPAGGYYHLISDVPAGYRPVLDKLVQAGILRGTGGAGENRVLNLGEDAVRVLVLMDRAGAFAGI